ncbi:MAG: hypothetical protein EBV03_12385, partial [Proteobacteria bacterium]|nr:hypothetical protein [Pseudomonadota bacterium]
MAEATPDPMREQVRRELEEEALKSARGELKEAPVYGTRREPIPGTRQRSGNDTIMMFRGRGYINRSYRSSVSDGPKMRSVREQVGTRGVPIVYPSPGDAPASDVLEQFFQDNLYKQPVRFSDELKLPLLVAEAQQAHRQAELNPAGMAREDSARARAGRVYSVISGAEREYIARIAREDKDAVALDIMRGLRDFKEADVRLESGGPSAGHMLVLAQGNGTQHHHGQTNFDGGMQSQERVAKMDATLDATITRMETAIRNDRGTFRDSSQRAPGPVVNVLRDIQRDAADGVLGNSGVDYRNVDAFLPKAEEMQLWMKVRKQVSGDSRVQDPDVQQLERDREVVVK